MILHHMLMFVLQYILQLGKVLGLMYLQELLVIVFGNQRCILNILLLLLQQIHTEYHILEYLLILGIL